MAISPVKRLAVPQHLHLVKGKQKLWKNYNVLEEKHTKLKSCVADTVAISEDNLSDCNENALILKQKADDLDHLMTLVKEKMGQSKQDEQIQLLILVPELWTITQVVTKFSCITH